MTATKATSLTARDGVMFRDPSASGDVTEDPRWRELMGLDVKPKGANPKPEVAAHLFTCIQANCPGGCSTAVRKPRVIKNPEFESLHDRNPDGTFGHGGAPSAPKKAAKKAAPAKMTPAKARERLDNAVKMFGSDRSKWTPAQRHEAEKLDAIAAPEKPAAKTAAPKAPAKKVAAPRKAAAPKKPKATPAEAAQAFQGVKSGDVSSEQLEPQLKQLTSTQLDAVADELGLEGWKPRATKAAKVAAVMQVARGIEDGNAIMGRNVPAAVPGPRRTDEEISRELADLQGFIRGLEEEAKPRVQLMARLDRKALDRGMDDSDLLEYDQAKSELEYYAEEGQAAANNQLDLLTERDGSIWGGTPIDLPAAEPTAAGPGITREIQDARHEYVIDDPRTMRMNKSLRSSRPSTEAVKWAARMRAMVDSQKILNDSTVYRGAALSPAMIMQMKPGAVIRDKGFISTDGGGDYNPKFFAKLRGTRSPGKIPVLFKIKVPKGVNGFDANYGEFVFGPGTPIRVAAINRTPEGGVEVVAEMLPKESE